jgi:hypothetical protein
MLQKAILKISSNLTNKSKFSALKVAQGKAFATCGHIILTNLKKERRQDKKFN